MSKPTQNKNIQIPDNFLKELLTSSEKRMLKNRWQIINLLKQGLSIRKIASQVKVGTDTVVRTARLIESSNINILITKSKKNKRKIKSQTPWIFGKSD
ncbi:helix-turn-helix domain-containing protein [Candidatus Daviesbacteria bacterium]|nr:helix-turn-helix domain-containing protein [Candidatus Daviesbacteria bacterium]